MNTLLNKSRMALVALGIFSLSACGTVGSLFESDEATGGVSEASLQDQTVTLGFNGYLWRAALDTTSKFPIQQVDSRAGIINSDWMTTPDAPEERIRVTVYILDKNLRADAVRVEVFRQVLNEGNWVAAPVQAGTALKLEEAILVRARELRIRTLD